jgi:hypothetical protein
MRTIRQVAAQVVAVVVLAAVLATAGCGGSGAGDEAAVETVFRSYHAALLARDFATACALNAPETSATLVRNVNAQGGAVTTCEEALGAVYAGPGAAVADRVSMSAQVEHVTVSGDTASIAWTFDNQGAPEPVASGLRRIDGQWRLLALGA